MKPACLNRRAVSLAKSGVIWAGKCQRAEIDMISLARD